MFHSERLRSIARAARSDRHPCALARALSLIAEAHCWLISIHSFLSLLHLAKNFDFVRQLYLRQGFYNWCSVACVHSLVTWYTRRTST